MLFACFLQKKKLFLKFSNTPQNLLQVYKCSKKTLNGTSLISEELDNF